MKNRYVQTFESFINNDEIKFIITDIQYDLDDDATEELDLPDLLEIIVPKEIAISYEDIEEYISNEISNITGFTHNGFSTTPQIEDVL